MIDNPVLNYSQLLCGLVLLIPATLTLVKVVRGSKSLFAYAMIAGAYCYAFKFLLWYSINMHPKEQDFCNTGFYYNFYVHNFAYSFYVAISVQQWIFALKYLQSSQEITNKPVIQPDTVYRINQAVSYVYLISILISLLIKLATFPGYGVH